MVISKIFGSLCFSHVSKQLRRELGDRSQVMVLVGDHLTGAYKLLSPSENKCHTLIFNPKIPHVICIIFIQTRSHLGPPPIHLCVCFLQGSPSTSFLVYFTFLFIWLISYLTTNQNTEKFISFFLKSIVQGKDFQSRAS